MQLCKNWKEHGYLLSLSLKLYMLVLSYHEPFPLKLICSGKSKVKVKSLFLYGVCVRTSFPPARFIFKKQLDSH